MRLKNTISKEDFKIMVLDDEQGIIDSLSIFLTNYHVTGMTDPIKAIEVLKEEHYDLLILDFLMMPIHGDQVVEEIRKFNTELYILLLTGHKDLAPPLETIKILDIQGYCEKSGKFDQLLLLIESGLKSVSQMRLIKDINDRLKNAYTQVKEAYLGTIEALRLAVDAKDTYTRGHSDRVSYFSVLIGKKLGLSNEELETLKNGGLFHDIGKIGIPDSILQKPIKLTPEEYSDIKNHPTIGAHILAPAKIFNDILPIVKHHHERFDGKGYPSNLMGEDIPILARIAAVADSFDAMTSDRHYRARFTNEKAIEELINGKGTQFDPIVVDAFITVLNTDKHQIEKDLSSEMFKKEDSLLYL